VVPAHVVEIEKHSDPRALISFLRNRLSIKKDIIDILKKILLKIKQQITLF